MTAPRTCGAAGSGGPCNRPATHVLFYRDELGNGRGMDCCEDCAQDFHHDRRMECDTSPLPAPAAGEEAK